MAGTGMEPGAWSWERGAELGAGGGSTDFCPSFRGAEAGPRANNRDPVEIRSQP